MTAGDIILEVKDLRKEFVSRLGFIEQMFTQEVRVTVLRNVNFKLYEGEVFGLVGESGSGKSTLAQIVVGLVMQTSGTVLYRGANVDILHETDFQRFRVQVQLVFQDPSSSLNPRKTIGRMLHDPLRLSGVCRADRARRVTELLAQVGLSVSFIDRYPHELSGGQRQRVGIARALAMQPSLLIADEPVSALDVSLQAQILNLLLDLRRRLGLTIILISHDLAVVGNICTRMGVMYAGSIVEIGEPEEILRTPAHPYTAALLASVPAGLSGRHRQRSIIGGDPPDPARVVHGCRFAARCPHAMPICRIEEPPSTQLSSKHFVECHLRSSH